MSTQYNGHNCIKTADKTLEIEMQIKSYSFIIIGTESPPELDFHEFGLWDVIFNAGKPDLCVCLTFS